MRRRMLRPTYSHTNNSEPMNAAAPIAIITMIANDVRLWAFWVAASVLAWTVSTSCFTPESRPIESLRASSSDRSANSASSISFARSE